MKTEQQPFKIRGEINQLQIPAPFDRLRVTASGAILCEAVGVEKDERSRVPIPGFIAPPPSIDGVFDNPAGISAAGDDDVETKKKALFVAELAQPLGK